MKIHQMAAAVALIAGQAVFGQISHAQDAYAVEELYQIRDFETAALNRDSVEKYGTEARFNVHVEYRDPDQRPPNAPASRVIRYNMRCKDKSMVVLAVVTMNERRELMKNYLIPPGGMDFQAVAEGSREEGWLKEVCG